MKSLNTLTADTNSMWEPALHCEILSTRGFNFGLFISVTVHHFDNDTQQETLFKIFLPFLKMTRVQS